MTLGNTTSPASRAATPPALPDLAPPPASRVHRPTWRDPRLWVGVVLVAGSVVLGARAFAAADDTVAVWAAAEDTPAGAQLAPEALTAVQVRFGEGTDAGRYLLADQPLPAETRLARPVDAGELLPRAALEADEATDLLEMPVAVEPEQVSGTVVAGSSVHVYLVPREPVDDHDAGDPVLADVDVLEAAAAGEVIGASGRLRLVLAVPEEEVSAFYDLLGALGEPQVFVAAR